MIMFQDRLEDLQQSIATHLASRDPKVKDNEWKVIKDYLSSLVVAMKLAVSTYNKYRHGCSDGSCNVWRGYPNLDEHVEIFEEKGYTSYTCDDDEVFARLDEKPFEDLEEVQSHYQKMLFYWNEDTNSTCFNIELTVQICEDYRPQYHEMSVHYAARYLNNIKRFLWVGGGDSMLLHEILKYPSLEVAVGLEIDQKV
eukprot:11001090-Ditylum_brightwellii.AAC.1